MLRGTNNRSLNETELRMRTHMRAHLRVVFWTEQWWQMKINSKILKKGGRPLVPLTRDQVEILQAMGFTAKQMFVLEITAKFRAKKPRSSEWIGRNNYSQWMTSPLRLNISTIHLNISIIQLQISLIDLEISLMYLIYRYL